MEVRATNVIRAFRIASWPTRIGARNDTSSIDAVTASVRQWRCATIAAARSIQCITLPPSTLPSVFASLGRTNCAISTRVSRGLLAAGSVERAVDVLQNLVRIGMRALLGELDALLDLPLDPLERGLLVCLVDHAALHQDLLVARDGIALLPVLHFLLRPVVRRVNLRMAVPPVGLHLDQRRSLAAARAANRFLRRLVDKKRVVPVD